MEISAVINHLFELGFRAKQLPYGGYTFDYEGLHIFYNPDEDDEDFFRLLLPGIYEIEEDTDRAYVLEVLNEVNLKIKYAKIYIQGDSVWVAYETKFFSEEGAEDVIRLGIVILRATYDLFKAIISGEESLHMGDDDDDDDDDEDIDDLSDSDSPDSDE